MAKNYFEIFSSQGLGPRMFSQLSISKSLIFWKKKKSSKKINECKYHFPFFWYTNDEELTRRLLNIQKLLLSFLPKPRSDSQNRTFFKGSPLQRGWTPPISGCRNELMTHYWQQLSLGQKEGQRQFLRPTMSRSYS